MIIETHCDYAILCSDSACFMRENGSKATMKFEVRVEFPQSLKVDGHTYIMVHENGTIEWMDKDDGRDTITRLEI